MADTSGEPITIVVPVKDRAHLVTRTLDSIKAQTWRPLRVIVVDNASTDATPETVERWIADNSDDPGFNCRLVSQPIPGCSAARNLGLEEVETRLMMHFDSDDTMAPGHVESVMKRFAADDYPDLVCFRVRIHSLDGKVATSHKAGNDMAEAHIFHSLLRTQGFACETALARRAGAWDETLECWVDLEFGLRLALEARKRAYIPDVNVDVMAQKNSITGEDFSSKTGRWEKALDAMETYLRKIVNRNRGRYLRYIALRRALLAAHYKREGNPAEGRELLSKALKMDILGPVQRSYLKLAYAYTALGGRGASIPARFLM